METEFTPFASLLGGILIGLSAVALMAFKGRIMGATGILAGLIAPQSRDEALWRAVLILGMITGPILHLILMGRMPEISQPVPLGAVILGGLLVGLGVTFGGGCTSGHGVCGMARLSRRSIVATLCFMAATAATVYVIRHVIGG